MKVLVLSDSHAALRFMRLCVEKVQPDCIIHLGDYYDDGQALSEEYPEVPLIQVPGNCDRYRCPPQTPEILIQRLDGVNFYLTHGHRHHVKQTISQLTQDGQKCNADVVLYGHTHICNCYQQPEGMWILNPGSCGYDGGSAGLVETHQGRILQCRVLKIADLI